MNAFFFKKHALYLIAIVTLCSFGIPSNRYKLKFTSLHCIHQEDWTGSDQVYIKINGTKVTETVRISTGQVLDLSNMSRYFFDSSIKIEVYEYDWEGDDLLLSATISGDEVGEGFNSKYGTHWDAKYRIHYEVLYNY
jgi:hypothetical protein